MPFGEIVVGSPGSGNSQRPISIVNLDPANDNIPYPCAIDIASLITLQDAMSTHELGPNDRLKELGKDAYVLFDLPGQVELKKLGKSGFRLAAVHLCDSHLVADAAKYVSVLLLSLRAMLHLELPHINVLSKIDLLTQYGDLDFNLEFYTEVQDLSYLENALSSTSPRYTALNMAICSLIEDFGLVGFETLAVEVRQTLDANLTRAIDRATGYVFVPAAGTATAQLPEGAVHDPSAASSAQPNVHALLSSAMGPRVVGLRSDVRDVQERWVDAREEWDAHERALWRREGEALGRAAAEVEKQQRKLNIRERK
ncbi:hypothetical protein BJV77DRAFT_1061471 [Russula vinacea]|nr:hypothetical protein BJV77DRAFT_1061471 [Russula vinacea]